MRFNGLKPKVIGDFSCGFIIIIRLLHKYVTNKTVQGIIKIIKTGNDILATYKFQTRLFNF